MSIDSHITDPSTKLKAEVIQNDTRPSAVVATHPWKTYYYDKRFFVNSDYGVDMNHDVSSTGPPLPVHNGIDNIYWTGSVIIGKTIFNSGDRNHTELGTQSIKTDDANINDVFQIANGVDLDCNGYSALTIWINVDKNWLIGDVVELYGWDTTTNTQVGTSVDLKNYFAYQSYDNWQKISIPLTDMGDFAVSTTLDAIRVRQVAADGPAPKYYLDDIQFEEKSTTAVPIEYVVRPESGTWLHVNTFQIIMADEYSPVVTGSTMPNIPYNSFFGVPRLDSGITYRRYVGGVIQESNSIKQFLDVMSISNTAISGYGSDGTNSWVAITMTFIEPIVLRYENEDKMTWTVNDNLSGLLDLRISLAAKVEVRG